LFIKNLIEREKFVLFSYKIKNLKKPQKNPKKNTFLVGFLGGFFWVGFLMPTLHTVPLLVWYSTLILSLCSEKTQ
jgi:hypothetical protein